MSTTTAPAVVGVKAVSHVAIRVTDLDRAVDFYSRVFGYDVFIDNRPGPTVLGVIGGLAIELIKSDADAAEIARAKAAERNGSLGHTCMAFSVDDIDATHALLKAAGLTKTDKPEEIGAVRVVFIRDPDGALLEFIQLGGGAVSLAELAPRIKARAARDA
jgi:glyoxylase I family protein